MKKRLIFAGFLLILAIGLAGCADKKPAAPQETAPQENAEQGSEIQSATVIFFKEPVNFLAQEGVDIDQTNIVFNRNRAACIDEIERLASMIKSIDKWSAGTAGRDELYVDGGFGLSDDERLYYFSYTDNTIFYEIISMDPETEKVNVEFYFAALSATDMEYIRSLKDSKDGFKH